MRKVPGEIENFIDNIIIDFCDVVDPYFRMLNITANHITTLSLISAFISLYYICLDNYKPAALFFLLSYIFDVMDGNYARKYNMASFFGDWYDHSVDVFKLISVTSFLSYKLYLKGNFKTWLILFVVYMTMAFMMLIHLGCIEKHRKLLGTDTNSVALSPFIKLCYPDDIISIKNFMRQIKYFGSGTFISAYTLLIYMFDKF